MTDCHPEPSEGSLLLAVCFPEPKIIDEAKALLNAIRFLKALQLFVRSSHPFGMTGQRDWLN